MKFFLSCFSLFLALMLPLKATSYKRNPRKVKRQPPPATSQSSPKATRQPPQARRQESPRAEGSRVEELEEKSPREARRQPPPEATRQPSPPPKSSTEVIVTRALSTPERDFQGTSTQVSETGTEAASLRDADPTLSTEFCCNTAQTQGFAQEASPQENQQQIAQILSRAPSTSRSRGRRPYGGGASGREGAR